MSADKYIYLTKLFELLLSVNTLPSEVTMVFYVLLSKLEQPIRNASILPSSQTTEFNTY